MAVVIDVTRTLRLAQQCLQAPDAQVAASAESVVSYLVLHLKHSKAPVPARLQPHVERLEQHAGQL